MVDSREVFGLVELPKEVSDGAVYSLLAGTAGKDESEPARVIEAIYLDSEKCKGEQRQGSRRWALRIGLRVTEPATWESVRVGGQFEVTIGPPKRELRMSAPGLTPHGS